MQFICENDKNMPEYNIFAGGMGLAKQCQKKTNGSMCY